MTESQIPKNNFIIIIANVVLGLFFLIFAPFLANASLNKPLHRLVEVYQPTQPNGAWFSPVKILTVTYLIWIALYIYAGAALIVLAKFIYEEKEWAYPSSLTLYAIPSIGGMTMTIPWIVLVLNGPVPGTTDSVSSEYGEKGAGMAPAVWIMLLGLLGYYLVLFLMPGKDKSKEGLDWQRIISKVLVFTMLGVLAGFTWMNAQHGVRFFLERDGQPFMDSKYSNPEMFLGGYLMYTTVLFFLLSIYFLGAKKEVGIWIGVGVTIITTAVNFIVFIDRIDMPSGQDWLRGALLSLFTLILLLVPWIQKGVLEQN